MMMMVMTMTMMRAVRFHLAMVEDLRYMLLYMPEPEAWEKGVE